MNRTPNAVEYIEPTPKARFAALLALALAMLPGIQAPLLTAALASELRCTAR